MLAIGTMHPRKISLIQTVGSALPLEDYVLVTVFLVNTSLTAYGLIIHL